MKEKQAADFKEMLSFFYSGTLPQTKRDQLIALLELADQYQVKPTYIASNIYKKVDALKELCGQYIAANVHINEVNYLIDIAEKYNCKSLMRNCGAQIAGNFCDYEMDKLFDLNLTVWEGMLQVILLVSP
jgi:hypothetical protein